MKKLFPLLMIIMIGVCGTGCGGADNRDNPPLPPAPSGSGAGTGAGSTSPITVTISPQSVTLSAASNQQFTATLTNDTQKQGVIWSFANCSGPACGTIDADGKYTAPANVVGHLQVMILARAVADLSRSAVASVEVRGNPTPNDAKLQGHYVFLLSGYDGDGIWMAAGSLVADGQGGITSGTLDQTVTLGGTHDDHVTGYYSVGDDNRGNLAFSGQFYGAFSLSIALNSFENGISGRVRAAQHGYNTSLGTSVTGWLVRQDPNYVPSLNGNYVFLAGGQGTNGDYRLAMAGRFTTSGGQINGSADYFDGATAIQPSFADAYTLDASGRGSTTIAGQPFIFYIASDTEVLLMQKSPSSGWSGSQPLASGFALRQSSGPFTAAALNGPSVMSLTGSSLGRIVFDGHGGFAGTFDQPDLVNAARTGTYSLDADGSGRGRFQLQGETNVYTFYLVSPGRAVVVDLQRRHGTFEPQSAGPFINASLAGDFSVGTLPLPMVWTSRFMSGAVHADGSGSIEGTLDNGISSGVLNGTYSVEPNGRITVTTLTADLWPQTSILYLISPSKAVGAQNEVITVLEK